MTVNTTESIETTLADEINENKLKNVNVVTDNMLKADAHLFCVVASSSIEYQFFKHLFSYDGCSSDLRHMYIAMLDAVKSSCTEQNPWMLIDNRGAL